jgi:hypothetical protein
MLVSSFLPLLEDFLIRVAVFARRGICCAFLALCPKLLVLDNELFKLPHEILQGWSLMGSRLGAFFNDDRAAVFIELLCRDFTFIFGL